MNSQELIQKEYRERKWWIAAWFFPVLVIALVLWGVILPVEVKKSQIRKKQSDLSRNILEPSWLDSTRVKLQKEISILSEMEGVLSKRLDKNSPVQTIVDSLRNLATQKGLDVLQIDPSFQNRGELRKTNIRMGMEGPYYSMISLLEEINVEPARFFVEELRIKRRKNNLGMVLGLSTFTEREKTE